jgi:hypothetical protein
MTESESKVKVLAMGEPIPIGVERIVLAVSILMPMPDEETGKKYAQALANMFDILKIEGAVAVIGAQVTLEPDVS